MLTIATTESPNPCDEYDQHERSACPMSWDGALERINILNSAGPGVVDIRWQSRPVRLQC